MQSSDEDAEVACATDDDALWRDGYYCCAIEQVEEVEHFFRVCYNCKKAGHVWCNCTEPLRPVLQEIKDCMGADRLNTSGDGRNKGAATPQKDKGAVAPSKPKK